jgi:quercetin dioxygenase-like cupin family protein
MIEPVMDRPVIEDPVGRQRFSFWQDRDDDGAEVLHVEMWVEPGGGVPAHVHPAVEERFEVLAGRCSFLAGRRWQEAGPGETVLAAPGVRHAYRNRGDELTHVVCHARPPSTLQPFLEEVAAYGRAGALTRHALPKTPGVALDALALAHRHRDMVHLGFPLPPWPVQRLLFPLVLPLARRRAARAAREPT